MKYFNAFLLGFGIVWFIAGCDVQPRETANRPTGADTLSDRQPPDRNPIDDYVGDCGPCACDDEACYDSITAANQPRTLAAMAPAVKVNALTMTAQNTSDSSIYKVRYSLSKALLTNDTVYLRLRRDSAAGITPLNLLKKSRKRTDTLEYRVDKVFGKVATYRAILQYRRGTQTLVTQQRSWTTNFPAKIDSTPPVVDTLEVDSTLAVVRLDVKPDSVSVLTSHDSAGNLRPLAQRSQQFCALVVFADGKVALRSLESGYAPCVNEYSKLPLAIRSVSADQQQVANRVCVKWTATGGTITAETCGTPS